ncbi:anaerobic sulfite reductase subunit AsrA [Clostridium grantii]|uniref:Anaerobic sulfite reductase subunit A n=1 Tax=Clostridium grantii DSM 8605 TaxID=1121316 RepID=A0A1M5QM85_9CLOT|nr:anaerobic sulfite reductase subunit AsrA [Clostridium grantii]SHH14931.1 anaerobic sulfite reductase subunit A [Clostridium grantii DSM 8605]
MGIKIDLQDFNIQFEELKKKYKIYAPVTLIGKGSFSDSDSIKYKEINSLSEVEFKKKSNYSAREIIFPITQTLFYFTEESYIQPRVDEKDAIILLRSCDIHGIKRLDEIYLSNGREDSYYKILRQKVKFAVIGCQESFENCFCVDMGTNSTEEYEMSIELKNNTVYLNIKDEELNEYFKGEDLNVEPTFVNENKIKVNIPENIDNSIFGSEMWEEYNNRCIACGRCNFVCPTCTCFTMQDIFYKDNPKNGERRRVWASCHVDKFSDMAGGHGFRTKKGERMRFKVMHKVHDFKKRFGYHMCVGCGRCDDICPEYISFSNCVNKLNDAMNEVK